MGGEDAQWGRGDGGASGRSEDDLQVALPEWLSTASLIILGRANDVADSASGR